MSAFFFITVVIITSSLNSIEAQQVIQHFEHYRHTKLFLIDMFGTIFNSRSHFYTYLSGNFTKMDNIFLTWSSGLVPNDPDFSENSFRNSSTNNRGNSRPYRNLLVLTVLTEKLKHLLNKTLHVEFEKYSEWMLKKAFVDDKSDDIAISSVSVKRDRRHIPYNNNSIYSKESLDFSQRIYNDSEVSSDVEKQKIDSDSGEMISEVLISNINVTVLKFLNKLITFNCDINYFISNYSITTIINKTAQRDSFIWDQCPQVIDCYPKYFNEQNDFCYFFCHYLFDNKDENGDSTKSIIRNSTNNTDSVNDIIKDVCVKVKDEERGLSNAEEVLVDFVKFAFIEESKGQNARRWRRETTRNEHLAPSEYSPNQLVYSEFFSLFDFIVSILYGANESGIKFDFIVLDLHRNVNVKNESTFGWRPFLVLQQNHINHQVFTTHPLLRGFRDWGLHTSEFWTCGILCWGAIVLTVLLLLCVIVASVAAALLFR